ncbi:MAG TPA: hypothetical protein VJ725_27415 [Thermoanaerobaculia bacterium]|nr:hypothetical protein [Thermoanaerobaculia bacterium]
MTKNISILLTAVLVLSSLPAGAATFCDTSLAGSVQSPLRYQERQGRCEGIYAQEVGAVTLDIRSLVQSFGPFDPQKDAELELAWLAPPGTDKNVHLRAFSLRPRHYYRMDTSLPAARGAWRWPTDLLASEKLDRDNLGVVAWIELPGPGNIPREVYLPLRVQANTAGHPDGYEVKLVPSKRLKEVRITVSRLDARGNVDAVLRRDEELSDGYYPSNEPFTVSIGDLGQAGFYRLEVSAKDASGYLVEQDLELYHSGK